MTYFEFFSKYSDMFYYLTFLLGVTNISYNFFEYLNKYDSSPLSKLEGRIHTRLNDIDNKINMLYKIKLCEISHAVSDSESESESDTSESIIEDEDIHNENENEKSDSETEEDTSDKEDSDSDDKEELQIMETIEELEEPEENVCVDQNDINDYYKDKFIKDKQSNSLSLSGVFKGWY